MVGDKLPLDLESAVFDVPGHLVDAVLEAGEFDDDRLPSLPDEVGSFEDDDLVVDGILGVVNMDLDLSTVHDSHFAVLERDCLAVHFRILLDLAGLRG